MSKAFLRDTVVGGTLDLPSGKNITASRLKRLWEFTGGALVDGLKDEPPVASTPRHHEWAHGYSANDNHENIDSGPPFRYGALPDSRNHIRLLQILPGGPQDDVRCFVYPVALDDCPEFEALSYCWGNVTDVTPITINGHSLGITKSLRSALFHLRRSQEPRTLWVDAICINQGDAIERANQVSIMGDIYGQTARTVVWLGSGDEDSKRAFKNCEQLASEAMTLESNVDPSTDGAFSPAYDKNDSCLENLVDDCIWWKRVWVVQEIILAKDALLVCGSNEIDWKVFCRAIDRLISAKLTDAVVMGLVEGEPFRWYKSIVSIRSLSSSDSLGDKFLDLLLHVREREATNPRDKVFSVLGLMEGESKAMGISPDYESTVQDVFTSTAVCILKHSSTLDLLGAAPTNASDKDLPSWVPSWAYRSEIPKPMRFDARGEVRSRNASRGTRPHLKFADRGKVLVLSGHEIDSISGMADVLPIFDKVSGWEENPDPDEDAEAIEWFRSAFVDIRQISGHLVDITNRLTTFIAWENFVGVSKDQKTPYWQTICAGCGLDDSASMEILYREWHSSLSPIRNLMRWRVGRSTTSGLFKSLGFMGYMKSTWNNYPEFGMLVEAQAAGRRLARTARGSLCLVPSEAKHGDYIIVAKGGRVPLVVRRSELETKAVESWTLVGECYVHGVMNGEAFREEDCDDIHLH